VRFEESESDFPTYINEDVSDDGRYFTYRDVCLI